MKLRGLCLLNTAFSAAMLGLLTGATPRLMSADAPLVADTPSIIPDCKGGFDFLEVDAAQRRLLASHKGNGTLDVFDLDSGNLIKHVPAGEAQGLAMDPESGKYFVGACKEQMLVIIDAKTLTKTGEVKLPGEADAICFDAQNHCVYVGHDNAPEIWVVDPRQEKIVATVKLTGQTEVLQHDSTRNL